MRQTNSFGKHTLRPRGEVSATEKSYEINVVLVCRVESRGIAEVRGFYDVFDLMSQLWLQV
jgi:ketosteroid isomerase-like protein